MPNLTKDQITLLHWMSTGRKFEVCSDESCPKRGDIVPKRRLPIQVSSRTISRLVKEELIIGTPKLVYGIRWDAYSITAKGKAAV
ncbi:MarR family transcriptional regulator [Vibrio diazotrophicus]